MVKWILSAGGPLIVLPEKLLEEWMGALLPCVGKQKPILITPRGSFCYDDKNWKTSDYGRACYRNGESQGFISVGTGKGLVLETHFIDDNPVTWWALPNGGLLIQCNFGDYSNTEASAIEVFMRHPNMSWEDSGAVERAYGLRSLTWRMTGTWELLGDALILFDSALAGLGLKEDYLRIPCEAGIYEVMTAANVDFGNDTELTLHRLIRR
jgi:hypothetical protein